MHVIPGGHGGGPRVHFSKGGWQLCDEHILQESHLALPMTVGDLMLFDGKLPHGTPTNRTDDWRWALQFHYLPRSASEVDKSVRQQAAVEESVESQTLGNRQHNLPVRDRGANFFGQVKCGQ